MTEPMDDRDLTPRERRALREKQKKKEERWDPAAFKEKGQVYAKRAIIPAIVVLFIAVIAGAVVLNNAVEDDCPGHEHASFRMFIDEEQVSFQHPQLDLNAGMRARAHFHQSNDYVWHLEGGCINFKNMFAEAHVSVSSDKVVLEGVHEQLGRAGTYEDNETSTWRVFLYEYDDNEWTERSLSSMLDYQMRDGQRLLLTYGDSTDEEIQRQKAAVPFPEGFQPKPEPDAEGDGDDDNETQ